LPSRLNSFFSSRFCSFFSCFVNFPSGEIEGAEAASGIAGGGDGELIGSILRGLNLCA